MRAVRAACILAGAIALSLLVLLLSLCGKSLATVTVQAHLTDPTGSAVPISFVQFDLQNCGFNIPAVVVAPTRRGIEVIPTDPVSFVQRTVRMRPVAGVVSGTLYGNDEISCGGVQSSLWHVTAYSDSNTPLVGDRDYLILASLGTPWNLASANPFVGNRPPPGFQSIFLNPTSSQSLTQPANTSFKIIGNLDLSLATLIGVSFGGGSGNATQLQSRVLSAGAPNNLDVLTWVAANNQWQPSPGGASSNATSIQGIAVSASSPVTGNGLIYNGSNWAPANVTGFLPLTGGTLTGLLTLSANPSGALDAAPKQYVDSSLAGKADLVTGLVPTSELGSGTASGSTCLLGNQSWGPCASSSGTVNFIPKFTGATTLGNSGMSDSGTTVSTAENVDFASAISFKLPVKPTPTPIVNGLLTYDSTNNLLKGGFNGATKTFATIDGNIATATALAADPTDCAANQYATTIGANGNLSCAQVALTQLSGATNVVQTNISNTFTTGTQNFAAVTHSLPTKSGTLASIPATCTVGELYFATDATAGQNLYECAATNIFTQQLNSGGGGGASTSLNNLVATAINQSLLPNAAGTLNLGSGALPWTGIFLGGAATNNINLTGTATAARTATLPNNTGTLAELNLAQTWTATQTFAGTLASSLTSTSANPSTTGFMRLAGADAIKYRDTTTPADRVLIQGTAGSGPVQVGDTPGVSFPGPLTTPTLDLSLNSATNLIDLNANGLTVSLPNDATNPVVVANTACISSAGNAVQCSAGFTNGSIGIAAAISGGNAVIVQMGSTTCTFDNGTVTPGHFVGMSATSGLCTDLGTNPPGSQQNLGVVRSQVAGVAWKVQVSLGSSAVQPTATVLLSPPATQTIQGTSATTTGLIVKQPVSGSVDIFSVQLANGNFAFRIDSAGTVTFGTTAGAVSAAQFISNSSNPASNVATNLLRLAKADVIAWNNNAGTADILHGHNNSDVMTFINTPGLYVQQLSAATGTTLSFSTPAVNQTLTVPDSGGASDTLALLAATQTLSNKSTPTLLFPTMAAPSNPAGGNILLYGDSTTGNLTCLTSSGGNCISGGGGGGGAWSGLTDPAGNLALSMANNSSTFTMGTNTPSGAFTFQDTTANVSTSPLVDIHSVGTSTAVPLRVTTKGTANGFKMGNDGNFVLLGTTSLDLSTANAMVMEVANEGVTGTTQRFLAKLTTAGTAIITTTSDVGSIQGVVVDQGGGTSGNARIAIAGITLCAFDNTSVIGNVVVASITTAGKCHDSGSVNQPAGFQLLGWAKSAGTGNQTVILAGRASLGIQGTTNQVNTSFAGGILTLSTPQDLATASGPTFAKVLIGTSGNGISGTAASTSVTITAGLSGASNQSGTLTLAGGGQTSASSTTNKAGDIVVRGGNNAATASTGRAGHLDIQAGQATGAANLNGHLQLSATYIKDTTYTTGNVQCFSADNKVSDCATNATNFLGVALAPNGNAAIVALMGSQLLVNYDFSTNAGRCNGTTCSPVAGDFVCTGPVAGKLVPQAGACTAGQMVGIVEAAGTAVTTGLVTTRH